MIWYGMVCMDGWMNEQAKQGKARQGKARQGKALEAFCTSDVTNEMSNYDRYVSTSFLWSSISGYPFSPVVLGTSCIRLFGLDQVEFFRSLLSRKYVGALRLRLRE